MSHTSAMVYLWVALGAFVLFALHSGYHAWQHMNDGTPEVMSKLAQALRLVSLVTFIVAGITSALLFYGKTALEAQLFAVVVTVLILLLRAPDDKIPPVG